MKVALILTGGSRTFHKCGPNILQNLVLPNKATVFALMEGDQKFEDSVVATFQNYLGKHKLYKSCKTKEYHSLIKHLLATQPAIQKECFQRVGWNQNFIVNGSGTTIAYYQLLLAYDMMLAYERENNTNFDIVIRCRYDFFFDRPIEILKFFTQINEEIPQDHHDLYRRSCGDPKIYQHLKEGKVCGYQSYNDNTIDPEFKTNDLLKDINESNYLWVLGLDQFWFGKRHTFDRIYTIMYSYGKYKTSNRFTFNSETQFIEHCRHHNVKVFNYYSKDDGETFGCRKHNLNLWKGIKLPGFTFAILRDSKHPFTK